MIKILKQFIPPIFLNLIRNLFLSSTKKFSSYEEVEKHLGFGYNNEKLVEVVSKKTRIKIDQLYSSNYNYDYNDLKLISFFFLENKEINVLDVGGGAGLHYHVLRSFSKIKIKWHVLETPEMVNRNKYHESNELKFIDNMDIIKESNLDLIYLNSVIQYINNPYSFLDKLFDINCKKIVITRTPFMTNHKEFYSVQKSFLASNGPGPLPEGFSNGIVKYPLFSFNLNSFKNFLDKKNFKNINYVSENDWKMNGIEYKNMTILITK